PSNGAPMISTSAPAQDPGSARLARGTPRKVTSGPYIPPSRGPMSPTPPPRPMGPPKISAETSSMPGRRARFPAGARASARRHPVHQGAVGGVGEVEAGLRQVGEHVRRPLPEDDPADVHPAG